MRPCRARDAARRERRRRHARDARARGLHPGAAAAALRSSWSAPRAGTAACPTCSRRTADEMVDELKAGRPVLVLQNLRRDAAAASGITPCSSATTRTATSRCCAPATTKRRRDEVAALRRHLAPRRALRDDDAASRRDTRACGARAIHRRGRGPRGRRAAAGRGRGLRCCDRALAGGAAWPGSAAATSPTRTATARPRRTPTSRAILLAPGECRGAQQPGGAPAGCRLPRRIAQADRARLRARGRHGARGVRRGKPRENRRDARRGRRCQLEDRAWPD